MNLNQTLRSDYYFGGEDGKTRQFGRVQASELLSNIDSMEDELTRYYNNADENNQIIEGIISPFSLNVGGRNKEMKGSVRRLLGSTLFSYKVSEGGFIYAERGWDIRSSYLYSWIAGLKRVGITTFYTINYVETAHLLSAIYRSEQKPTESHHTLNRVYLPKIRVAERNPLVVALMGMSYAYKLEIGEDKATSISQRYKSLLDVAMSTVGELCECSGIGKKTATKLLSAIGRENE